MDWIKIFSTPEEARSNVVEGKPQLLIVRGKRICLGRHGDKFYAIDDRCSHNGESLSKGKINSWGEVICPWHGHRFDLKTGKCAEGSAELNAYPIMENDTGLFLAM